MKHFAFLLAVLMLVVGCVSPGMAPPKETFDAFSRFHIIAMEPPPLQVPPQFNSLIVGGGGSVEMARGFGLFNTVLILLELPETSKRGGEISESLQSALEGKGTWTPTVVLANELRAQLAAKGMASTVAPDVRPLPGVQDRSYTVLMENWLGPIRAWYNDTKPVSDYAALPSDPSLYVLEVGISNYEMLGDGELLLQVMMKVIRSHDGCVVGRARAADPWNMPKITPFDQSFANDAKGYKEIFETEGRKLVKECLDKLGISQ